LTAAGSDLAEPAFAASEVYLELLPPPPPPRPAGLPTSEKPFPTIGHYGHQRRMQEKLLGRGPEALADDEVLEILLFSVFRDVDAKPVAQALINRFGSFTRVLAAPPEALLAAPDIGLHAAAAVKIVQVAALRMMQADLLEQPLLNNWERLLGYLTAALSREKIEQFRVLFLDSKNCLIADETQARGTVNHTPVYPREVVKRALELHATALILVHNHPSGDPTPSLADIEMTAAVRRAAAVLEIAVHDHLIRGRGKWTSFRREGLL
jgi:DNA repair protein RadC